MTYKIVHLPPEYSLEDAKLLAELHNRLVALQQAWLAEASPIQQQLVELELRYVPRVILVQE